MLFFSATDIWFGGTNVQKARNVWSGITSGKVNYFTVFCNSVKICISNDIITFDNIPEAST